ncbi:MAG: MFS transporter [Oscillospiraceae bacterium]|nr:MFS transporter [Oscillospiraceae bacterium]
MFSFLIVIIYIAFISLGLPDSITGSAWPVMHGELAVPLSYVGIVTMIIAGCTIISGLTSDWLTRKLGAGLVTAISVAMTAVALFGFSVTESFLPLCFWAIPYGLGAGAVDAALNNYVALHYASRHMSWLHCFWGVGAATGPYIMSYALTSGAGWNNGYRIISVIQIVLTVVLFASLPMWKKRAAETENSEEVKSKGIIGSLKIKGVPLVLVMFFGYCALEATAGIWASSYLVEYKGTDAETAARFASLFYIGITVGRFVCGFVADRIGDRNLIRIGLAVIAVGLVMIMLPVPSNAVALAGLVIVGIGCAPIYPSVIHATPANFGKENSQAIIGIQMASAYVGTTFMPPLFGVIAENINIGLYPFYMAVFAVLMVICSEWLNRKVSERN